MKRVLLILLLFPLISIAQKTKKKTESFLIINAGGVKFEKADPIFAGSFSAGGKLTKILGIGIGAEYMQFKGDKNPYIPIFFQVSAFEKKNKVTPFFSGRIGLGNYNNTFSINSSSVISTIKTTGGLYFSPSIGVLAPAGKIAVLLSVAYVGSSFKTASSITTITRDSNGSAHASTRNTETTNTLNGFNFSLGLKI